MEGIMDTDEPGSAPATVYGTTSDGEEFTLSTVGGWKTHDDAVTYVLEYARSVTGTDSVELERFDTATIITARGPEYAERITVPIQVRWTS